MQKREKTNKPEAVPQDKIKEPSQPKPKIDEPAKEKKHPPHQGYHGTDDERTLNPEE